MRGKDGISGISLVQPGGVNHTPGVGSFRSLITGIRGQDGTYLARELEGEGREVFGLSHHTVDYRDRDAVCAHLDEIRPREIYHLASPSCIQDTREFEEDILHMSVTTTQWLLRWIADRSPETRLFFASSSEIFGDPAESPQNEDTAPRPENPYAIAKVAGGRLCAYFREKKGVFACAGILYNHESPLRRADFVSRRITRGAADIAAGRMKTLALGNLDARRDWSHAADFVRAFRLALEAPAARDYVLASGRSRTVRDFCEAAFAAAGFDYREYVIADPALHRADFAHPRLGNPARAREFLGWTPRIDFTEMVGEMVRRDQDGR